MKGHPIRKSAEKNEKTEKNDDDDVKSEMKILFNVHFIECWRKINWLWGMFEWHNITAWHKQCKQMPSIPFHGRRICCDGWTVWCVENSPLKSIYGCGWLHVINKCNENRKRKIKITKDPYTFDWATSSLRNEHAIIRQLWTCDLRSWFSLLISVRHSYIDFKPNLSLHTRVEAE